MREEFIEKRFTNASLRRIAQANEIIEEYQAQGFTLTLRQLYYQFVSRDLIPNKQTEYKRLGSLISDARLAGHVDWDAIEDRTRFLRGKNDSGSPSTLVRRIANGYHRSMWENQNYHVEVWIEKDALIGVIEKVCGLFDLDYYACKGYNSQSEAYAAGKRFEEMRDYGSREVVVLHLGDHDPSGIDMTRDNEDRSWMFSRTCSIDFRRLALNMDQIEQYGPPPNPTKLTDSRAQGYIQKYGDESWELDALNPQTITELIENEMHGLIDQNQWDEDLARIEAGKEELREVARKMSE